MFLGMKQLTDLGADRFQTEHLPRDARAIRFDRGARGPGRCGARQDSRGGAQPAERQGRGPDGHRDHGRALPRALTTVNSPMNPILVACMGVGYLFQLLSQQAGAPERWRAHPHAPLPATSSNAVQHPSYIDYYDECWPILATRLRSSRNMSSVSQKTRGSGSCTASHTAYHGVPPHYAWIWAAHGIDPRRRHHHRWAASAMSYTVSASRPRRRLKTRSRWQSRPWGVPPKRDSHAHAADHARRRRVRREDPTDCAGTFGVLVRARPDCKPAASAVCHREDCGAPVGGRSCAAQVPAE